MPITDLRKELKPLYSASARKPAIVDVPKLKFLTHDGQGHPTDNPDFQQAFEALYSIAYTLKFTLKLGPTAQDFKVMPPEGLWWTEGGKPFDAAAKQDWRWRLMIAVPDFIAGELLRNARKTVKSKKGLSSVDHIRLKSLREGKTVQLMHIGPYDQETETIERMREFADANSFEFTGKHHEIYLSDPRRTAPEKLKTILRHPLRRLAKR